jgi:hypothetical protein
MRRGPYTKVAQRNAALLERIGALKAEHPFWGYRRRFDSGSRSSKRNSELGGWQRSAKTLILLTKVKWVPNGQSEQPQRKTVSRERFRVCQPSAR